MSIKKIKTTLLIISLLFAINLQQLPIYASSKNLPELSENKKTEKIIDKKAGFLLEENSIKVIKPFKEKSQETTFQPQNNQEYSSQKEMYVEATAYSSSVAQCDASPFITASGTRVHFGTVAANFLPFGTKIKIPEYFGEKIFVVEDRMAKRYWYRIDIWMPSYGQAISFGKRNVKIVIVD